MGNNFRPLACCNKITTKHHKQTSHHRNASWAAHLHDFCANIHVKRSQWTATERKRRVLKCVLMCVWQSKSPFINRLYRFRRNVLLKHAQSIRNWAAWNWYIVFTLDEEDVNMTTSLSILLNQASPWQDAQSNKRIAEVQTLLVGCPKTHIAAHIFFFANLPEIIV